MTSKQKFDGILQHDNFRVDSKDLTGCWGVTKSLERGPAKQNEKDQKQQFFVTLDHYC